MSSHLAKLVADAQRIAILTGAGISTESGIPDFRSPGGIWSRYRIIEYGEFIASPAARIEDWRRRFEMEDQLGIVHPNRGHDWVADCIRTGRSTAVITQNVDGLHQAAGIPPDAVIELHGNARHALCLDCGTRHEIAWCRRMLEDTGLAPSCAGCGGIVKSAVVMFGEQMPQTALRRAEEEAQSCDLFLVLGSSLAVYPAASLPLLARQSGARLAIVNLEPTEFDPLADCVIHAAIGETVTSLMGK